MSNKDSKLSHSHWPLSIGFSVKSSQLKFTQNRGRLRFR